MAVWDIRMFREVHSYNTPQPGASLAISDRGLTAVGWGTQVSIWRGLFDAAAADQGKVQSPYMSWGGVGQRIERVRWCPYEDVLGIGTDAGFSSAIVPGAGEPNWDAGEANPFETVRGRQDAEVRALLTKLQPDMISLDPDFVGRLDLVSDRVRREERAAREGKETEDVLDRIKKKQRGRNSALRRYLRKRGRHNVIDDKRLKAESLRKEGAARAKERQRREKAELGPALGRFAKP